MTEIMESPWPAQRVEANGISLNVYRTGGDGPSVILLHGITDDGLCWLRTARALEDRYDVLMIDARGHGESDRPTSGYSPGDQAADVAGVINALELKRPVLVGHSMGGSTTASAAAMVPDLLRGIVLIDPPWREEAQAITAEMLQEWRKGVQDQAARSYEDLYADRQAEGWNPDDIGPWAASKAKVSLEVSEYLTAQRPPWRDVLPRIDLPTLLITGDPEQGGIITPAVAQEAAELLPQGEHVHLPGTGHNIQRDDFDGYMQALNDFLNRVAPAKAG